MGRPIQGWDPVILISQIISLQTIHYLMLSLLVPPLLSNLTDTNTLTYSGGAYSSTYIMDWREMASRSTAPRLHIDESKMAALDRRVGGEEPVVEWYTATSPHEREHSHTSPLIDTTSPDLSLPSARQPPASRRATIPLSLLKGKAASVHPDEWDPDTFDYGVDRTRGWILGLVWVVVSAIDIIPIYLLVRKPTHVLDFSVTLAFVHICLTTYHAGGRFPFSLFFWAVIGAGSLVMIVGAEQLCVRREMGQTLKAASWETTPLDRNLADELDEIEMGERG